MGSIRATVSRLGIAKRDGNRHARERPSHRQRQQQLEEREAAAAGDRPPEPTVTFTRPSNEPAQHA